MTLLQNAIKEVAEELGIKKNKPIVANHEDLLEILKKQKEEDSFVCEMIGYRELSYGQLRFFVADVASNLHFCKLLSSFVLLDITLFFIFSLVHRTKFGEYTYVWTPFDQMKAKMEPLQYAGLQEYPPAAAPAEHGYHEHGRPFQRRGHPPPTDRGQASGSGRMPQSREKGAENWRHPAAKAANKNPEAQ